MLGIKRIAMHYLSLPRLQEAVVAAHQRRESRADKFMRSSLPPLRVSATTAMSVALALLGGCASAPTATQPRSVSIAAGKCTQPPYPAGARDTDAEGTTTLAFEVDAEGKVTRAAIIGVSGSSIGHRLLDALALETVNKCVFPPAPGFLPASSKVAYQWRLQE